MAEIGITASLIGITSAAISLTRTLYDFGSTTSAAREQVDYIAKNVSFYSDVLELLVEQFDSDRPIHSRKALHLAEKLHDHSYDLLDRIRDLIPDRNRSRDQFSFIQRIAWNFKKTRVDFLVGELENLKSTVQLLVQVLCAARQIHAYQTDGANSDERKRKKKREAVDRQCRRAENVIVEWQRTQENLLALREAADGNDLPAIQAVGHAQKPAKEAQSKDANALVRLDDTALAVINTATSAAAGSESDKRALVLQNTANWLEQLIDEWTVPASRSAEGHLNTERPSSRSALHENTGAANDLPAREYRDGPIYEEREPGGSYFDEGNRYREEEPRITSRKYDGYERERRSDIKQPEKERKSTNWPERAANDLPFNVALKFKQKAAKVRETVKEKTREKEAHASSAKTRDRDQRSGMPQASAAGAIEVPITVIGDEGGRRAPRCESDSSVDAVWDSSGSNGRRKPERMLHAKPRPNSYHDSNSKHAKKRDSGYADTSGRQSRQRAKPLPHDHKRYQYLEYSDEEEDEHSSEENTYPVASSVPRRKTIHKTTGPGRVEAAGMTSEAGDSMRAEMDGVPGRRGKDHLRMRDSPLPTERRANVFDKRQKDGITGLEFIREK